MNAKQKCRSTLVGAMVLPLLLVGCVAHPQRYAEETNAVDMTSAFQLVPRDEFENIDLVALVDPKGKAKEKAAAKWADMAPGQKIDAALNEFYVDKTPTQQRAERDRIQERLLAASTQRCNAFKGNLQRQYSRNNFLLGLGSTVSGVVGAVVPGVQASKNLSAASGIFSGARAEWNQDYLSNVAVNVIIDGIETRQRETYNQIVRLGQSKDIGVYNLEAALKDALFYHGQCSTMTGLQVAAESIKLANDPGIDAATRILLKFNNLKKASAGATDLDMTLLTPLDRPVLTSKLLAGTPRIGFPEASAVTRGLLGAKLQIDRASQSLLEALKGVEGASNTEAQKAVLAAQESLTGSKGVLPACLTKAGTILTKTIELQAALDNASDTGANISLSGDIETQSKLAGVIEAEFGLMQSRFLSGVNTLQTQIMAKTLTKDQAKTSVSAQIGSYSMPGICN